MTTPSRIALIAGAGRFPFHVADEARRQGVEVTAVGIQGWADPSLAGRVAGYAEISVGHLGRLIKHLKAQGVQQAIMAGKVTKSVLLGGRTRFDAEAALLLARLKGDYSVPAVLGAIGRRLEREGIRLLDSSTFLRQHLCPEGPLTARRPSADEQADVRVGVRAARAVAAADIGQTVVVKDRVVVAVEALEGTDAAIRRAQELAGVGLTVVKLGAPGQDRRFDLPVVGPGTAAALAAAGARCLALEAGIALLLDRDALVAALDRARIAAIGVKVDEG